MKLIKPQSSKYSQEQIDEFIKTETGIDKLKPNDDLFGVSGDDFHELIEVYAKTFHVDMSNYRWYFHAEEEGISIGSIFYRPPYKQVVHIPVTPSLLLEFANSGYWDIRYPDHKLPKHRPDLILNSVLGIIWLCYILYSCLK